ncbi:AraC family ligand binding domain-containing protein [Corallococcus sp. NCSPR001]|uniref:AraC family ligand binding domain-containing protein n=1 Tax=Corallococcus sp. NCRR TaxID=2996782 RepID=UPI001A8CA4A4|nr:AraC family ligand binding domain-containing protein [Corallococcus sp. NCSPR001]
MASTGATENQVKFWTEPALESVEYLHAEYRDFAFPAHFHEAHAIGIIERGAQRFRPGRSSPLLMPEGSLCVIHPGMVHEGHGGVEGGWRYRMFYPSAALVLRALESHQSPLLRWPRVAGPLAVPAIRSPPPSLARRRGPAGAGEPHTPVPARAVHAPYRCPRGLQALA